MFLYVGTLCLSLGFLLFVAAVLGIRRTKQPFWASETMMSYIISPLIVALFAFGVAGFLQSLFPEYRPSVIDMAIAFGIVAVTAALYVLLGIKKKMAQSEQMAVANGEVIHGNFKGSDNNSCPSTPSPSDLPKAA